MHIAKHKVVAIDYTLTDDDGQVIDSSDGADPLSYLHGEGNIIPGLERALEAKTTGDQIQVSVEPDDGYGEHEPDLRQEIDRGNFSDIPDLEVGMQFRVETEPDGDMVVTVVEIGDETVVIDGNHPLAGIRLNFDVTVRDVRDATAEEIEHGHAHGAGGHEH